EACPSFSRANPHFSWAVTIKVACYCPPHPQKYGFLTQLQPNHHLFCIGFLLYWRAGSSTWQLEIKECLQDAGISRNKPSPGNHTTPVPFSSQKPRAALFGDEHNCGPRVRKLYLCQPTPSPVGSI